MSAGDASGDTIDETDRVIWSWCVKEIASWQSRGIDFEYVLERFAELNETRRQTHLFRIYGGQVSIAPKPANLPAFGMKRASHYREFIQSVVDTFCPELDTTIAIDSGDGGFGPNAEPQGVTDEVPIFVFQKSRNAHGLLLPDIDFLVHEFYQTTRQWQDQTAYDDKSCSAIFVGSTTGGRTITKRMVEDLTGNVNSENVQPRLRAAFHFQDNPNVQFLLPNLHQCDSKETEDLLREMEFCRNVWVTWGAQFSRRFIISMDGNGATCSRVAVALRSNSVLLKYASPHQLYYFSGLSPWIHYIPIESDEDVDQIVRVEQRQPGYFRHIAAHGQAFANRYLTRPQAIKYTGALLRMYASSFGASSATA